MGDIVSKVKEGHVIVPLTQVASRLSAATLQKLQYTHTQAQALPLHIAGTLAPAGIVLETRRPSRVAQDAVEAHIMACTEDECPLCASLNTVADSTPPEATTIFEDVLNLIDGAADYVDDHRGYHPTPLPPDEVKIE